MEKYKEYISRLEKDLNPQRLNHSIRVMETSEKLARLYGEDIEKARLGGLLHDCGKYDSTDKILQEVRDFGIILDSETKRNPKLVHSDLGSYRAEHVYGVEDEDILAAIKYHTIGRKNMSKLEKIVYLADMIEPRRNFPGVEDIRVRCLKDLDDGLLFAIDHTIKYLIDSKSLIHPNTIDARNSLIL